MSDEHRYVTLNVSDGTTMRAYCARPAGSGRHPGILVFQEAFGVNGHIRSIAERFASLGFVAIAPELFHRTGPGFEGSYTNFDATRPHTRALTTENLEMDIRAAHGFLASDPTTDQSRIVSIGFCMGGRVSFIANSILQLRAAASFYGGGIAPALLNRSELLRAPMIFFWGGLDRHIGTDQIRAIVDALRTAGKQFINVEVSDADHGFFNDERAAYNANAAEYAWGLVQSFFRSHTKP